MSTTVGTLTIEMAANIARLQKDMDAARKSVGTAMGSIEKSIQTAMRSASALFAGVGVSALVGKLVSVQREFDVLNASLITVTGSSADAERAFAWIRDFAATTPYSLNEVTQAFVKMKALGLDASEEALRSYGNTASAMGKSLNQMIEAVADAATGEFERLKEFGIRAKSEGDRVSLTFRGVTTNIGKNAAEIEGYLRRIGDVEFAGAMELRAKTLDGTLSNLADTWDQLFRTIAAGDAGGLIAQGAQMALNALESLIRVIEAMNTVVSSSAAQSRTFGVIMGGLATIFETVAVIGVNVKYVISQIINEVAGLGAQIAALASGNFAEAGRIREQMLAQAEAARREVDMTTKAILDSRNAQSMSAKEIDNDLQRLGNRWAATGSAAALAYKAQLSAATQTTKAVVQSNAAQVDSAKDLARQRREELAFGEYMNRVVQERAQEQARLLQEQARLHEESLRPYLAGVQAAEDRVQAMRDEERALEISQRLNVSLAEAVEMVNIAKLKEKQIDAMGNPEAVAAIQREIEAREKLLGLIGAKEARDANAEAARRAAEDWQRTWDQVAQSMTDALMQGGRSIKEYLQGLFRSMVLRPILQPVLGGMAGMMGLPGQAMAGGGGAGGAGSMAQLMGGGPMAAALSGFTSYAATGAMASMAGGTAMSLQAAQALYSSGAVTNALGMAAGAAASVLGGYAAGSALSKSIGQGFSVSSGMDKFQQLGMALGSAINPIFGAIIGAGAGITNRLFGRRLADSGIAGDFAAGGFSGQQFAFYKGGVFRSDKMRTSALDADLQAALSGQFAALQTATANMARDLGLSAGAVDQYTRSIRLSFQGLTDEQIQQKLATEFDSIANELAQLVLGAGATAQQLAQIYAQAMQERAGLELQLLQLQGNSAEIRRRERDALHESNRALYDQIKALEDSKTAAEEAARAHQLTAEAERAATAAAIEQQKQRKDAAEKATNAAFAALERAIDAQRTSIMAMRDAAQEQVDNVTAVFDVLKSNIEDLYNEAASTSAMGAAAGQAFIAQALATARSTGYLPDSNELSQAIGAARGGLASGRYASAFEAERDRLVLAGRLSQLREISGNQLTTAEQQLKVAEQQLESLDGQLATARAQLDAMRGVDQRVLSVEQAIRELNVAMAAELRALGGALAASKAPSAAYSVEDTPAERQAKVEYQTGVRVDAADSPLVAAAKVLYQSIHGGASTAEYNAAAAAVGGNIGAALGWNGSTEDAERIRAQYGFAAGGLHDGGVRMVGENGPEIEVTGPARYYSAGQTAAMLGGGAEVANEVRQLREENQAQARAMVQLQARVTRLLERWDGDGMPETRSVTA